MDDPKIEAEKVKVLYDEIRHPNKKIKDDKTLSELDQEEKLEEEIIVDNQIINDANIPESEKHEIKEDLLESLYEVEEIEKDTKKWQK